MPCEIVQDARIAWKLLNGIFSVYKPAGYYSNQIAKGIKLNVCRDLNELKGRPISEYVAIEGAKDNFKVAVRPNYADHPLVVGPRYQIDDMRLSFATPLGVKASGVLVVGINDAAKKAMDFHTARPLRTFRLKGRLGLATDNMFIDGKPLERASYSHVRSSHMEKTLAIFQAAHQKQMFIQSGVDLQSQTAYELAVSGLLRPQSKNVPFVYSFKCVDFNPPDFTIEIQSINEYEDYLVTIIHDVGHRLRTLAVCTGIQCTQHGCLTVEHTLLRRHWNLPQIINSIKLHEDVMKEANFNFKHEPFLVKSAER